MSSTPAPKPPHTAAKLGLLGALYLSQGLPFGFFTQALPVMMRQLGRSLEEIGLTSLLALPWALKFLWAPLVDRTGWRGFGRRKSWIVPLQALTALALAASGWLDPANHLHLLFVMVLFVNLTCATQDIATDGLAVELLTHRERGLANGLQVGGYRLGMVLGGGVLLILYARLGWRLSLLALALTVLACTLPALLHREGEGLAAPTEAGPQDTRLHEAAHFLRLQGVWPLLGLLFLFKLGEALANAMIRPFLTDRGLGLADIGWLLGTVGFAAGLAGALAGGWLAGRLGRKTALVSTAVVQLLTLATYLAIALSFPGKAALAWVVAAEHFGSSMATAALFTCMMDWSRPGHAGSDYTVQACAVVIASGLGAAVSGVSAHRLGYAGHFALALALGGVALLAAIFLFPRTPPTERPSPRVAPST